MPVNVVLRLREYCIRIRIHASKSKVQREMIEGSKELSHWDSLGKSGPRGPRYKYVLSLKYARGRRDDWKGDTLFLGPPKLSLPSSCQGGHGRPKHFHVVVLEPGGIQVPIT